MWSSASLRLAQRHSPRVLSRLSYPQVQHRLGIFRANSSAASIKNQVTEQPKSSDKIRLNLSEPHLAIAFTCTADGCNHRSAHTFARRSYERGIVLVQCPSCKNRHLIADNLGWFKDDTENGRLKNVEDILRARGEHVQRGTLEKDGVVEVTGG